MSIFKLMENVQVLVNIRAILPEIKIKIFDW